MSDQQKSKGEQEADSPTDRPKYSHEILRDQISEGQRTYDKSTLSILLSSLTAGLEISFSYLLLCSLYGYFYPASQPETVYKLMSFVYPVGFIFIVLGQSILFTEKTSLLALPVFSGSQKILDLLRLWGLVILGNLLGGMLMAGLLVWVGPQMKMFKPEAVEKIALHVLEPDPLILLTSAVLAGWLMGLLSWLITSSKETVGNILLTYIITAVIGFAGLHHSIVGNVEVFAGLISSSEISFLDYLQFLALALVGNAIGGVVFVALLKYRAFITSVRE